MFKKKLTKERWANTGKIVYCDVLAVSQERLGVILYTKTCIIRKNISIIRGKFSTSLKNNLANYTYWLFCTPRCQCLLLAIGSIIDHIICKLAMIELLSKANTKIVCIWNGEASLLPLLTHSKKVQGSISMWTNLGPLFRKVTSNQKGCIYFQ